MRLDRVFIDGYKNLKNLTVDFDEGCLTNVIIGQNGAGKSNLIEAIVMVFRHVDLRRHEPKFHFHIEYRIETTKIALSNMNDQPPITVDGKVVSRSEFVKRKADWFPDLVFGYYSGGSRRLESLFDSHQRAYYDVIKRNDNNAECVDALANRRLFYCRPIHGILALASFFAFADADVEKELKERLGIIGFDSMLAQFREPWYAKGGRKMKVENARNFWGAAGPAGGTARELQSVAFHPMAVTGNSIDDYRDKQQSESQYAAFLKDYDSLKKFSSAFSSDQDMFYALEAMDISDLIREIYLWVTRTNDSTGDVSFADLSDGERQLLMVLGLIRVSRGKRALFLLDEPDTHLNPHWQYGYLDLIKQWTGNAADSNNCHIIMTSHNPLTVSALTRNEVRVLSVDQDGSLSANPPYTDPKGLGFTSTLTEIFGLQTSLDSETQKMVDDRNVLARIDKKSEAQQRELIKKNDELSRLGFMFEDREPIYDQVLKALQDIRFTGRPPLTPAQIEERRAAMSKLVKSLLDEKGAA